MKTRRFATALESDIVSERRDQAPGFVSRMMVRSEGLCSDNDENRRTRVENVIIH